MMHRAVDSELPPRFDGDAALPAMNEPRADHRAVLEVVSEVSRWVWAVGNGVRCACTPTTYTAGRLKIGNWG